MFHMNESLGANGQRTNPMKLSNGFRRHTLVTLIATCCLAVTTGCVTVAEDDDASSGASDSSGSGSNGTSGAGGSTVASGSTGNSGSSSNGTSGAGGSTGASGSTGSGDGVADCSNVIVEGSYQVDLDAAISNDVCAPDVGTSFLSMVSQNGCSASASSQFAGFPISLDGELKNRGGSNAHGYAGSTSIAGMVVDYDVEFRCSTDPTCEYLDYAVVTLSVPAMQASCAYRGYLL